MPATLSALGRLWCDVGHIGSRMAFRQLLLPPLDRPLRLWCETFSRPLAFGSVPYTQIRQALIAGSCRAVENRHEQLAVACPRLAQRKRKRMRLLLIILVLLLLVGALPTWPYSSGWGYYPSGALGLLLIVLIVLFLMGVV
jgi:hypothetical protein